MCFDNNNIAMYIYVERVKLYPSALYNTSIGSRIHTMHYEYRFKFSSRHLNKTLQ